MQHNMRSWAHHVHWSSFRHCLQASSIICYGLVKSFRFFSRYNFRITSTVDRVGFFVFTFECEKCQRGAALSAFWTENRSLLSSGKRRYFGWRDHFISKCVIRWISRIECVTTSQFSRHEYCSLCTHLWYRVDSVEHRSDVGWTNVHGIFRAASGFETWTVTWVWLDVNK